MVISTVVVFALAMSAAAQKKPDFSGEWILNRQASTLSPGADTTQSGVVRIEHREPVFRYNARLVMGPTPFEYGFELRSDGSQLAGTQQGRPVVSSLMWDGDALLFESRVDRADGALTVSFRYELLDGGRRLRGTEHVRGSRTQDNVWIFDRRAP
jgi:hypothetical protein